MLVFQLLPIPSEDSLLCTSIREGGGGGGGGGSEEGESATTVAYTQTHLHELALRFGRVRGKHFM